jgi:hypothetical protein
VAFIFFQTVIFFANATRNRSDAAIMNPPTDAVLLRIFVHERERYDKQPLFVYDRSQSPRNAYGWRLCISKFSRVWTNGASAQ